MLISKLDKILKQREIPQYALIKDAGLPRAFLQNLQENTTQLLNLNYLDTLLSFLDLSFEDLVFYVPYKITINSLEWITEEPCSISRARLEEGNYTEREYSLNDYFVNSENMFIATIDIQKLKRYDADTNTISLVGDVSYNKLYKSYFGIFNGLLDSDDYKVFTDTFKSYPFDFLDSVLYSIEKEVKKKFKIKERFRISNELMVSNDKEDDPRLFYQK